MGQKPGKVFTIQSSDVMEGRRFYRLKEVEGGLFLAQSLAAVRAHDAGSASTAQLDAEDPAEPVEDAVERIVCHACGMAMVFRRVDTKTLETFHTCAEARKGYVKLEDDGALTRIAALQSQLKEAKEGWDSAIADLYAAAEIAKGMQSQLDALTWTEITPENLPKIGDELFAHHVFRVAQWNIVSSVTNIHATWRVDDFLNCGWTHFRPINPPPPSSAKGGDDGTFRKDRSDGSKCGNHSGCCGQGCFHSGRHFDQG